MRCCPIVGQGGVQRVNTARQHIEADGKPCHRRNEMVRLPLRKVQRLGLGNRDGERLVTGPDQAGKARVRAATARGSVMGFRPSFRKSKQQGAMRPQRLGPCAKGRGVGRDSWS